MKVQLVTPYRDTHLQRYDVTLRGNVTSVYPPLSALLQQRYSMIIFTESPKSGQRAWTDVTRVAKTAVILQVKTTD